MVRRFHTMHSWMQVEFSDFSLTKALSNAKVKAMKITNRI